MLAKFGAQTRVQLDGCLGIAMNVDQHELDKTCRTKHDKATTNASTQELPGFRSKALLNFGTAAYMTTRPQCSKA